MRTLTAMALAVAGAATIVVGQSRTEPSDPGSLAALTAEVRELRLAVQQLSLTQSQTQALGVYLSVQQSRILQVSSQLDTARRELDTAAGHTNEIAGKLGDLEQESRASDPEIRKAIQEQTRVFRREHATAAAQEQQARNREQELAQSLQAEESRWAALLSRLEALTQK